MQIGSIKLYLHKINKFVFKINMMVSPYCSYCYNDYVITAFPGVCDSWNLFWQFLLTEQLWFEYHYVQHKYIWLNMLSITTTLLYYTVGITSQSRRNRGAKEAMAPPIWFVGGQMSFCLPISWEFTVSFDPFLLARGQFL